MKGIPLVRSASLCPWVDHLEQAGVSCRPLLRASRIDPEMLEAPEESVPLQFAGHFIEATARRFGIGDFGIRTAEATPITKLGVFGTVIGNSLTLGAIVQNLIQWVPAVNSGSRVSVERVGEDMVELRFRERVEIGRPQIDAYSLLLLIDAVRLALGPDWRPREVALDARMLPLQASCEALSEARCKGEVDYAAFQFPGSALSTPVAHSRSAGDREAQARLKSSGPAEDFEHSLSQAIAGMLGIEAPTIEVAAELGGTSVRTMQRTLSGRGMTYAQLLDRVRFDKAVTLLEDSAAKLSEIAHRLGYNDPANFTRAFRRWTGRSPRAFRRAHLPAFA